MHANVHIARTFAKTFSPYLQAIKQNDKDADLYARRAAAHIKVQEFEDAVTDASKAIQLDPNHFRGFMMKGYSSSNHYKKQGLVVLFAFVCVA